MYYGTMRKELVEMFKAERVFRDKDKLDDDVVIDLTDMNYDVAPNLDNLEIDLESLQTNDVKVDELDEDVLYSRIIKEHAKDYKKLKNLFKRYGLRMTKFCVLLN